MNLTFAHVRDTPNIGDRVCCPADYFPEFSDCPRVDMREFDGKGNVVFGGGGLLHPGLWEVIQKNAMREDAKTGVWAIGSNFHDRTLPFWPKWMRVLDVAGIRDAMSPFTHVPCASCLSGLFDSVPIQVAPQHRIVAYEHLANSLNGIHSAIQRRSNGGEPSEFEDVLKFLCSGEIVITNTYHGVYWSLLLGRKVMVCEPFSCRFYGFGIPLTYCDRWFYDRIAPETIIDAGSDYLEKCRNRNIGFKDVILEKMR